MLLIAACDDVLSIVHLLAYVVRIYRIRLVLPNQQLIYLHSLLSQNKKLYILQYKLMNKVPWIGYFTPKLCFYYLEFGISPPVSCTYWVFWCFFFKNLMNILLHVDSYFLLFLYFRGIYNDLCSKGQRIVTSN